MANSRLPIPRSITARSRPRMLCRGAGHFQPTHLQARHKSGPYGYTQAKALVFSKYGEPGEVLSLHKYSISPSLPHNTVLLRTLAAPINPADINTIQGTYGVKLPFSSLIGTPEPSAVPGNEGVFEVISGGGDAGLTKGDWVIPAVGSLGTWRTHALVQTGQLMRVDKSGLQPVQVATVSVNPCTAYQILRKYGPADHHKSGSNSNPGAMAPLAPGSGAWFIQNGGNSGVGRAAIQLGHLWGLRSISVVRERPTPDETDTLRHELSELGADVVVTEKEFLAREWKDQLAELTRGGREEVGLALNCVGGKSATALARSLGSGGTMVSYGGMSRQPVALPTGLLIFKDLRFLGFWLSRWNERDPVGRKHMIEDILGMIREGRFKASPVDEVPWDWETEEKTLLDAASGTLGGFRKGKSMFVFGNT